MPVAQTLAGGSISPHLRWSGFPGQTRGFVLTCFDPDAPTPSGWWHWVVVDLTPDVTELARGAGTSDLELDGAAFHLRADHGEASYDGAAPPAGDRPHRYVFAVHALDCEPGELEINGDVSCTVASFNYLFRTVGRATITGTYENKG